MNAALTCKHVSSLFITNPRPRTWFYFARRRPIKFRTLPCSWFYGCGLRLGYALLVCSDFAVRPFGSPRTCPWNFSLNGLSKPGTWSRHGSGSLLEIGLGRTLRMGRWPSPHSSWGSPHPSLAAIRRNGVCCPARGGILDL